MDLFEEAAPGTVAEAFKKLLTEKHLYQYVEVDTAFVVEGAALLHREWIQSSALSSSQVPDKKKIEQDGMKILDRQWLPLDPAQFRLPPYSDSEIHFELPTIHTFCPTCEKVWPFNPVYDGISRAGHENTTSQWFFLGYQCQSCKGPAIRFLVRRDGLRLRLAGRDPIEVVPVPGFLPKAHSKYYGTAIVAHHAGQTLAGLFLLRVFIEQFWRSRPEIQELLKQDPRTSGEKQGEIYQATLPVDFRSRFPSLSDIYGSLSAVMHSADDSAELFSDSRRKIEEHFDAKRVFKIT